MTAVRPVLLAVGALLAVAVVAGAVLAYVAFGRQSEDAPSAPGAVASVVAGSAASSGAPASFTGRPPFRSCGEIGLRAGGGIPAARIRCLAATPAAGRELIVVSRTTEGDPIVRYFRTGPDIAGVEIFEDATADRFGGGWHRSLCRSGRIDQVGACA